MTKPVTDWKIVSEEFVMSTPVFDVKKQIVIQPDTHELSYYFIKRPYPFSIIIPISDDGMHVYLVGQYRIPTKTYSWEFPMGSVAHKNPLDTAKQELLEETGLEARLWQLMGSFYPAAGFVDQQAFVFSASGLVQKESQPETSEFLTVKKLTIEEFTKEIARGSITDGPTLAAFALWNQLPKEDNPIEKKKTLALLQKTYCRVAPSAIHGAGVIAVREIPQGINPFVTGVSDEWHTFSLNELRDIPSEVMQMIRDYCVVENDGTVTIPVNGLNGMDISFFLNNSDTPNIITNDGNEFITDRLIKKGEELTIAYNTYDPEYR